MYNPTEIEKEILEFWDKKKTFEKLMKKLETSKKKFSFYEGPPTANNEFGVHHALGRTYKDLFLRYKAMQGFKQRRQAGFDAQGLWVEVEVELYSLISKVVNKVQLLPHCEVRCRRTV